MKQPPWGALVAAASLGLLMTLTWGWQEAIRRGRKPPLASDAWQLVRQQYPMPRAFESPPTVPEAVVLAVVRANPFSPQRRQAPPPPAGSEAQGASAQPIPAQFVYKGQVLMGTKRRAILEETTLKKTYFLEAGQEIIGFKVREIAADHVTLSNLQTNEELTVSLTPKPAP